jgi:DNA-binding CsgD family transcriptional regulator
MSTLTPTTANGRDALIEAASAADSVSDLFAKASDHLRRLIPYDAGVWIATDPTTGLPTAPTSTLNMEHACRADTCLRVWELEFLADDFVPFRDLARAPTPAAGLHAATGGRPTRSARYREFMEPNDFDDELRGVLRVSGGAWASICLYRESGRGPFGEADTDLLASLSEPLGSAVRELARKQEHWLDHGPRGPGLLLFSPGGDLISANEEARAWLDELQADLGCADRFGLTVPMVVAGTLSRARSSADDGDLRPARARVRSAATGRWLVCHASCMTDAEGEIGNTALVIEPAKGSEVAPIIVEAYELTAREREIAELIAQGTATGEIAERLFLSPHTVRDHVKAIFEKVGVSSRGELVAKLFAEHYAPIHLAAGHRES